MNIRWFETRDRIADWIGNPIGIAILFWLVVVVTMCFTGCAGFGDMAKDAGLSGGLPGGAAVLAKFAGLADLPLFLVVAGVALIAHLFVENGHLSDTVEKLTTAANNQAAAAHDFGASSAANEVRERLQSHPNEAFGIGPYLWWALILAIVVFLVTHPALLKPVKGIFYWLRDKIMSPGITTKP